MEYLTIKDHQRSTLRGMDSFKHNHYERRGTDSIPRPLILSPASETREAPLASRRADEDWAYRRPHGAPILNSPPSHAVGVYQDRRPHYSQTSDPSGAPYPSSIAASQAVIDRGLTTPTEWIRSPQPGEGLSSRSNGNRVKESDDQQGIKLPSFNSLVEQLQRNPESGSGSVHKSHWDGRPKDPSYPPLEPTYRPSSSSSIPGMASSEPTSPHGYSIPSHPLLSPRARVARPHYRSHSRRSSESRNRPYTAIGPLSPRESHVIPLPTSHHRNLGYPPFPTHAPIPGSSSSHKSAAFQPGPPPHSHTPELHPYPAPLPRHTALGISTSEGQYGHSRTDSVLTSTEEYRFHASTFYANGSTVTHHQRKRRGNLPKDATKILRQWFDEHLDAPYPGEEVKTMLCHQTGLQMSQVNNWFINARRRLPRNDRPRKERESSEGSDGTPSREQQPNHKAASNAHEYWR